VLVELVLLQQTTAEETVFHQSLETMSELVVVVVV